MKGLASCNLRGVAMESAAVVAVRRALTLGLVVHAEHPDFGGVLTVGPDFSIVHHGGTVDVGSDSPEGDVFRAARGFVFQVGKRRAFVGAINALRKARNPWRAA